MTGKGEFIPREMEESAEDIGRGLTSTPSGELIPDMKHMPKVDLKTSDEEERLRYESDQSEAIEQPEQFEYKSEWRNELEAEAGISRLISQMIGEQLSIHSVNDFINQFSEIASLYSILTKDFIMARESSSDVDYTTIDAIVKMFYPHSSLMAEIQSQPGYKEYLEAKKHLNEVIDKRSDAEKQSKLNAQRRRYQNKYGR